MVRACIGDRNNLINLVKSGEAWRSGERSYKRNAFKREYGREDGTRARTYFHKVPIKDERVSRPVEDEVL